MSIHTHAQEKAASTATKALTPLTRALTPAQPGLLQRTCACGGTPGVDGECAACRAKRLGLQRQAASPAAPTVAPPIVHEVLRSPGQPLDAATRAFMEPRFGHDFSQVRIHTNARAAESARAVHALAYTVGRDVVFGNGRYAPHEHAGLHLLSHELAHVVQQTPGQVENPLKAKDISIGDPSDRLEQAAENTAEHVTAGRSNESPTRHPLLGFTPSLHFAYLARQPDDGDTDTLGDGDRDTDTPGDGSGDTGAASFEQAGTDDPRRLECGELGCPYKARCSGKLCEVVDCGRGTCPICPPGFGNLVISAWCAYRCYPSGSAIYLISRIGNFPIGPICLD